MPEEEQEIKTVSEATLRQVEMDEALVKQYVKALQGTDVPRAERPLMARLLAYYEIPLDGVKAFLDPTEENSLPEHYKLQDSKEATELLLDRIAEGKKCAVWLDYDADGNTSGAILDHTLKALGSDDHLLRIPHRTEGFGLNIKGVHEMHEKGVEMLIVADSGTVAHDQIAEARRLGMDVIVLDHHHNKEGEALPDALVVNPNRHDAPTPEHGGLAAASVSYLFARDLAKTLETRGETEKAEAIDFERLQAIAAIGVVADVVSLRDTANRYIVREGLKAINGDNYPGINAIKDIYAGTINQEEITAEDLAFTIGPGINAAGRLGDPTIGMHLLKSETEKEAAPMARRIKAANEERKILTEQIYEEAEQRTEAYLAENPDASFIMLEDKDWHYGIVGIVAGRIKEKYDLPTAIGHVYENEDGTSSITYSARSIEGVNFFKDAITPLQNENVEGMIKSGGHAMAAGMTIDGARKQEIHDYISERLAPSVTEVHANKATEYFDKLTMEDMQSSTIENVYSRLEPFGQFFKRPTYLLEDAQVKGIRRVGKNNEHIQFSVGAAEATDPDQAVRGGVLFRGVGTSLGAALTSPTRRDEKMDMVIEPFVRTFRGNKQLGFMPIDVANVQRLHAIQSEAELNARTTDLLAERRQRVMDEADALQSLPRHIEALADEENEEAQRVLKSLHTANAVVLDTETTGLNAGADNAGKANGLTQVAMISSLHRSNGNYAPRKYDQSILPVTPAHFGWKKAMEDVEHEDKPDYDRGLMEYDISPDALGVTNTSFARKSIEGPIEQMYVGPMEQDAKPFYEIATDLARQLNKFTPIAYNSPFDMPVLARHFSDVLDARPESGVVRDEKKGKVYFNYIDAEGEEATQEIDERLVIPDQYWDSWVEQVRTPLQNAFKVSQALRDQPGEQQLPETITNPAMYNCLMYGAMVHKGFSTQQRLQHIAPEQYGVAFTQDDTKHDALDDVGPLVYMLADQYADFGDKNPDMATLWNKVVEQAEAKGEAKSLDNGDIEIKFGKGNEAFAAFFTAFKTVSERNPRAKAYVGIREINEDGITLIGRLKELPPPEPEEGKRRKKYTPDYYKQPRHISLIKKTITHNDMMALDNVVAADPFDSTSKLDITLKADGKDGETLTIEDVPISSIRASTPFLQAHQEQLQTYLELLSTLGNENRVGRVVLEDDGITLKGQNGMFGEVKFLADMEQESLDVPALVESVSTHLDFLMKIGAIPGVHSTSRETGFIEEEDQSQEEGAGPIEPRTYVNLGHKNALLMEVRPDVMTLIADRIGVDKNDLPSQLEGGAIVHRDDATGTYLIEGTVENFREINMPLRDTSWLLHRLNNLPGLYSGETKLDDDSVILSFKDGIPVETLQILEQAHVPFTAEKDRLTVPFVNLMNDPFHWSKAISEEKQKVKNNLSRSQPAPPPEHLPVLRQALLDETLTSFDYSRDGNFWLTDGQHFAVPFDITGESKDDKPIIVADKNNHLDMDESSLLSIPRANKIPHAGLRYELGKLAGLERVPAPGLTTRKQRITFTAPKIEALDEARYSDELRDLAEHMQSLHIGPLEENLRQLSESEILHLPHHDDQQLYFTQASEIAGWVEQHEGRLDNLYEELSGLLDKELNARYAEGIKNIYDDVSLLQLMEHTLRNQQERGNLLGDPKENEQMIETVREYADALEKLAFKQERVREGCIDVQKRITGVAEGKVSPIQSLAKGMATFHANAIRHDPDNAEKHDEEARRWLHKVWPEDESTIEFLISSEDGEVDKSQVLKISGGNMKKVNDFIAKCQDASPYENFQMVRQLTGGLDKLWEDVRELQRSLDFSQALIAGAVALDDEHKREMVSNASKLIQETGIQNMASTLEQLAEEGAIKDIRKLGEGHLSFDATAMLAEPDRWANRLSELGQDATRWPESPYVIYDTSTLLTLLLAYEDIPDHNDVGLLSFVKDFAELGIETPVITDMVAAEFLNSPVPLKPEDIFELDEEGKATGIKYGPERMARIEDGMLVPYAKAEERLTFLQDLYNTGNVRFVDTRTSGEYMDQLRNNEKLQQAVAHFAPNSKPLPYMTDSEMKDMLLDQEKDYTPNLTKTIRYQKIRNDSGEVSIADAMTSLRNEHGRELPIFVRYEGTDVRSRIIQRLNDPDLPYNARVDKKYSPHNSSDTDNRYGHNFDRGSLKALGDTAFQSTGGMVASLAIAMREAGGYLMQDREIDGNVTEEGKYQWVSREKGKPYEARTFQEMYGKMLRNVGAQLGDERRYRAIKDVHAKDIAYNRKSEFQLFTGNDSPMHHHLITQDDSTLQELAGRHLRRIHSFNEKLYDRLQEALGQIGRNIGRVDAAIGLLDRTREAVNDNGETQEKHAKDAFTTRFPKQPPREQRTPQNSAHLSHAERHAPMISEQQSLWQDSVRQSDDDELEHGSGGRITPWY